MSPKDDNYASLQYELEPFRDIFTKRLEQIDRLVGLSSYAMRSMHGLTDLHEALRDFKKSRGDIGVTEDDDNELERVQQLEAAALEEAASDFPLLHGSATVLAWGALETSVNDLLSRWLETHAEARQIEQLSRVKISVAVYESYPLERRMRYLVSALEQEIGAAQKPGIGRYHSMLKPFGLAPKRDDELSSDLNEMAAVRNVIVHKAGIVDERFKILCPAHAAQIGDEILLNRKEWIRYRSAIGKYAANIIRHVGEKLESEENSDQGTAEE